eukprot:g4527.t1
MGATSSKTESRQYKGTGCLRFGCGQSLGGRRVQEDASWGYISKISDIHDPVQRSENLRGFFTVCDGHGGADAANFTSKNLMKYFLLDEKLDKDCGKAMFSSFLRADREFHRQVTMKRKVESGTTAVAMAIIGSRLIIANTGDCRAILSRNGRCRDLTTDHRPSCLAERKRIEIAGGFVDCDGYLNGDLGVSRAIGDYHHTQLKMTNGCGPLIADPDVVDHAIDHDDEFVVLVSDGVTEGLSSQTIIDLVRDSLRDHNCPDKAAEALVHAAQKTGVTDNLTAMVVCLQVKIAAKKKIVHSNSRLRLDPNSRSFADLVKALN